MISSRCFIGCVPTRLVDLSAVDHILRPFLLFQSCIMLPRRSEHSFLFSNSAASWSHHRFSINRSINWVIMIPTSALIYSIHPHSRKTEKWIMSSTECTMNILPWISFSPQQACWAGDPVTRLPNLTVRSHVGGGTLTAMPRLWSKRAINHEGSFRPGFMQHTPSCPVVQTHTHEKERKRDAPSFARVMLQNWPSFKKKKTASYQITPVTQNL